MKNFLLIGGFDGTGGAGILADCKVATALGLYPYFLTTGIAVQNSSNFFGSFPISKKALEFSLKSIFMESEIEFAKIGMIGNLELSGVLSEFLTEKKVKIILDTPMSTTSGGVLQLKGEVLNMAKHSFLTTPNKEEFAELGAENLHGFVLVKSFDVGVDRLLFNNEFVQDFTLEPLELNQNIRGTGCSLASAICCFLFLGFDIKTSISKAKHLIYDGMKTSKNKFLNIK